jgi:hypothetical protein
MCSALAHASEGAQPVQAAAAQHDEIGALGRLDKGIDRTARVGLCVPGNLTRRFEIDALAAGCDNSSHLRAEALGEAEGNGSRLCREGGAIDSDDERPGEDFNVRCRTCDQDGAGSTAESQSRHAAEPYAACPATRVSAERQKRRLLLFGEGEERWRGVPGLTLDQPRFYGRTVGHGSTDARFFTQLLSQLGADPYS